MKKKKIIDILKKTGGVITDSHIVLTSGRHSPSYLNKDALYPFTKEASYVGKLFAEKFKTKKIDVVAAPALGGIVLSQWTAYHLSKIKKKNILGIYTEKTPEKDQVFTRGYDKLVKGKNVLVIEDLTSTGASVKKVVVSVKKAGGKVVGVGVMINRDPKNVNSKTLGFPFYPLEEFCVDSYEPEECPLCEKGVPVNTTVGHGKKFLKQKKS